MSRETDDLRRLHFINALFSQITGQDLYLAHQIKSAIAFSLEELQQQAEQDPAQDGRFDTAFCAAAARLLDRFLGGQPGSGFYHWDATRTLHGATPLFARAEIMAGLKHLTPYREATLLVTNLRPALVPAGRRTSPRRLRDYDELLGFIRELAAARITSRTDLRLLFL